MVDPYTSINAEVDPRDSDMLDIIIVERVAVGEVYTERYRVRRDQRRQPGTTQVRMTDAPKPPQTLQQRVRAKVKAIYGYK